MCPAGTHRRPFAVSGLKPGVSYKSVLSGDGIPSTYSPASRTIYSEDFFLARIERAAGNGSLGYCGPVVSLKLNPQAIVSRPARRGSHGWRSVGWLICPLRGLYLGVPSSTRNYFANRSTRVSWMELCRLAYLSASRTLSRGSVFDALLFRDPLATGLMDGALSAGLSVRFADSISGFRLRRQLFRGPLDAGPGGTN